jgi:TolA-binding protein
MKKIAVASLLAITFMSACSSPEEPKATSAPPPTQTTPSIGRQYGETLKGGIDKAKEIQETTKDRIQQMDNAAKQNQPSPGE